MLFFASAGSEGSTRTISGAERGRRTVEKDKDRLDRILEDLARRGLIEFPVTDEFVSAFERAGLSEKLEEAEIYELYKVARSAYLTETLRAAKASLPEGPQTLGDILRHALAKAKVTDTELAEHLNIDLKVLRVLETNDYDPRRLPVPSLVNVMEMCLLRLGELVAVLQHSLRVMAERAGVSGVYARSDMKPGGRERGTLLGQAVDALLSKANKASEGPGVAADLVAAIRQEAVSRGRDDLIT